MAHFTFAIKKSFFCYFFFTLLNRLYPFTILIQLISINNSIFLPSYHLIVHNTNDYLFSIYYELLLLSKKRFYVAKIKRKTPLNSSSNISHFGLCYKVKFETKARILAMRLAMRGCWRPCYSGKFFCYFCLRFTGMQSKIASSIRVKSRYRVKL